MIEKALASKGQRLKPTSIENNGLRTVLKDGFRKGLPEEVPHIGALSVLYFSSVT
jgi:hypothetical protein